MVCYTLGGELYQNADQLFFNARKTHLHKIQRCNKLYLNMGLLLSNAHDYALVSRFISIQGCWCCRFIGSISDSDSDRLRQCLFNQNRYRYHIRFTKNITINNNHILLIYNESNACWETSIKVISDRWHGGHPKRNSMHTQWDNT